MIILLLLSGCSVENKQENKEVEVSETELLNEKVLKKVESLSLREKIGQMFVISYNTTKFDNKLYDILSKNKPGGFIVMNYNISTYEETKILIENIHNAVSIPMFIAIDEEGGKVQRLKSLTDVSVTDIPDMFTIGSINDDNLSYKIGKIIGEEVKSLGVNMVYGPVLDTGNYETSSLKKRIISSDPLIVKQVGLNIGKGILDTGVIPVYKHFPGIANTTVDSHLNLPVINKTKEELLKMELIPFMEAIQNKAEVMMVGHVNYPNLTNDNIPSSLNKKIITDLLRDELGYHGIVVTDAINMKALTNNYTEPEIYELGIKAGVDMFIMPNDLAKAIDIVESLVNDGSIEEELINKAVIRILKVKEKYLTNFQSLNKSYLGSNSHLKVLEDYNLK